jgi:hypothetical protein
MHLVTFNAARMRGAIDAPVMAGFTDNLDLVNGLAEGSPGFVWRLVDDSRDGVSARPFDDDLVIITLSVWESLGALRAFVFTSQHVDFLRRRREWFLPYDGPYHVLWWVPEGTRPTSADGVERLAQLAERGPTPDAFTFATVPEPA